ncbi:helix-turn-helix domain-containing protein [Streptomyces sp. NPDC057430]|uniref:helix-turn-helix domain-containing protein n=1 Tax=Streptomyces sp. NPDC057430 TaxID=3346131 RepID=UPI0036B4A58B
MTQEETVSPEWSQRLAQSIAGEVRRRRQELGLSAQQLSERCAALGMPIQRSVLANLESGRRTSVTVPEVLILAAALDTPPGLLLFPVGKEQLTEFLPGTFQEPHLALDWLSGRMALDLGEAPRSRNIELNLIDTHEELMSRLVSAVRVREGARKALAAAMNDELVEQYGEHEREMAQLIKELVAADNAEGRATEEGRRRLDELTERHERLSQLLVEESQAVRSRRSAQARANRYEESVARLEQKLTALRSKMRSSGVVPPLLEGSLSYLDPGTPTREDLIVRRPLSLEVREEESFDDSSGAGEDASVSQAIGLGEEPESVLDAVAEQIASRVIADLERRGLIKVKD